MSARARGPLPARGAADLRGATGGFDGELIMPDEASYDRARRVWNQAIDRRPAAVARCRDTAAVVAALRLARDTGHEVAVRGGGHSFTGFSTSDGGIVLDLGPMTRITVDPGQQTATVEPGVTWAAVTAAAAPFGLAPVGGHVSNVGVAGLTLGGGNGWFSRVFGLACDNLLSARVVTAAGEVVVASAQENPDLLWGLRGGGGNFGIVVECTLRLHLVDRLLAGMVMHRIDDAVEVLGFLAEFGAAAPDEVSAAAALVTAPPAPFVPADLHGHPMLLLAACHVGPPTDGERTLAPLRGFGRPFADLVAPMSFPDLQHLFDDAGASTPFYLRSHLGGPLTPELIEALVDAGRRPTSPASALNLLPMGGATRAIKPDATAFWHRSADYCLEIGAAWSPADDDPQTHRDWVDRAWTASRAWRTGVEVNHLGDEGTDRIREAYGDNYPRLAGLKQVWDPDNVFHLNQNVPPVGAA